MRTLLTTAALVAACGLYGCTSTSAPVPSASAVEPVTLTFALTANGQPAHCGAPLGRLGQDGQTAMLRDARFYVHDVALIDAAGARTPVTLAVNDWQNGQVALLDFEDGAGHCTVGTAATNPVVTGTVPAGHYTGLAFTLGVPHALNHTSTELEAAPLDIAGMGWSWRVGRKFAKIEIDPQGGVSKADGSRAASWYVHLGATGCTGNPVNGETVSCLRPNRLPVVLERFDTATQQVVLDLNALFQGNRLSEDKGGAVGCMSGPTDPECAPLFARLGLSLDDGLPTPTAKPSSVFGVAPKP